jgi:hypothetical protein
MKERARVVVKRERVWLERGCSAGGMVAVGRRYVMAIGDVGVIERVGGLMAGLGWVVGTLKCGLYGDRNCGRWDWLRAENGLAPILGVV